MFGLTLGRLGVVGGLKKKFSPMRLFAASGEQGAWYDPSDLSTLFQDSAGTIPVTADGQPVGKILDKSGRGNHASQATAAARPLYKTDGTYHWLQFDGVDDSLSTSAIDLSGVTNMDCFTGVKHSGGTLWADVWWTNNTPNGYWAVGQAGSGQAPHNTGSTTYRRNGVDMPSPTRDTIYTSCINQKVVMVSKSVPLVSGGGGLSISGYSGAFINGNIYSLIVRGALSTAQQITNTETWVNSKTGAY